MEELDIPILKKSYELYKAFHGWRALVPKADRYTLWQRAENVILDILEDILSAGQSPKNGKLAHLEQASIKLNLLRLFVRLRKDTKVLDMKKTVHLQQLIDEIGRMLGGWIKSLRSSGTTPPQRSF
ncbi:diversity-generating retroelement protein Avd [Candidatus Peregrinibacteria bacterium]|nr:diversity-generating retroelement protein Avd [Candidatus Peregrinibacteria bacterium]